MVNGVYSTESHRMSFPHIDMEKRTNDNFRNRMQPNHHKERSLMEQLPIDMIKSFPTCDPLHLLDLGIMKRLLLVWTHGDKQYNGKWLKAQTEKFNKDLIALNKQTKPIEIHRSVRGLTDLKFWKGTEFRSFLLYYTEKVCLYL